MSTNNTGKTDKFKIIIILKRKANSNKYKNSSTN